MSEFEEVDLFKEEDDKPEIKAVEDEVVDPIEDPTPSFEVPKKFQGKSFEDVVEAYTNLEKENGRKANEVGELRKLTDEILKQQVVAPGKPEPIEEVGFDDFLDDPSGAVAKAIESNPRLQKIEKALETEHAEKARAALLQRHEDLDDVLQSSEFSTWLQSSPTRVKMFQEAHTNYDADLGSELIDIYKATRKMSVDDAIEQRDHKAQVDLKKATVEKGSSSTPSKKVFRRSDLIRLKIQDPNRYAAMSDEIKLAYAEQRVK